jgi:hypothetical protein
MSFDLNIENYTREELIDIFELPIGFDKNIVEIKESKLRDSIFNNREINKETQTKTINFILKAKNIILNEKEEKKEEKKSKKTEVIEDPFKFSQTTVENEDDHMIQERPIVSYSTSYPNEFYKGVINPFKKRIFKINLNIDTRFRENYYTSSSTNYIISLPLNLNGILTMQMSTIELPTSFYVISKQYGNNFFSIVVNGESAIVNIPDGNYDSTGIMNVINNQLTNLGGDYANVVFLLNIYGGTNGTAQTMVGFNGSQTGGSTATIELNFQADRSGIDDRNTPLPLKFGWLLGFRNGVYTNNQNYVSEGIVDISGPRYLYLVVDDYNNNVNNGYFYSAFNSSILNKNILARISLQSNTFNILEQNNLISITNIREYFGPVSISKINIQLLDEYGRIIDLNNMDYSFCLLLTKAYDI